MDSYKYSQTESVANSIQGMGAKKEVKPKNDVTHKIVLSNQPEGQRKIFKDKIDSISTDDLLTVSFIFLSLL